MSSLRLLAVPLLLAALAALALPRPEPDYAAQLPRLKPREPAEALRRLRPGYRIELVAAEPLIRDPVAVDFDEAGRLYVVEYPEYNQDADARVKQRGCVKLLVDRDGDGRYDQAKLFAELDSPTAVACW